MLMTKLIQEFLFDCKVRELSQRTIHEYEKQLGQFRRFIREECEILEYENLKPNHVKLYISSLQDRDCAPSYINDLLKAVKCLCAYAYREEYTEELITKK